MLSVWAEPCPDGPTVSVESPCKVEVVPLDQEMEHKHLAGVGDRQLDWEWLKDWQILVGVEDMRTLEGVGDRQIHVGVGISKQLGYMRDLQRPEGAVVEVEGAELQLVVD